MSHCEILTGGLSHVQYMWKVKAILCFFLFAIREQRHLGLEFTRLGMRNHGVFLPEKSILPFLRLSRMCCWSLQLIQILVDYLVNQLPCRQAAAVGVENNPYASCSCALVIALHIYKVLVTGSHRPMLFPRGNRSVSFQPDKILCRSVDEAKFVTKYI
jgi:hypothetical protein